MSDIEELLEENLKDPKFVKAWEETEIEYQIKSMLIAARLEHNLTQKQLSEISTSPDFLSVLYGNPLGILVMSVSLAAYGGSVLLAKKIVNIKI